MEQIIKANNIDIYCQTFGDIGNEPIILLAGSAAQSILIPDSFCQKLANKNFFVIRFDYRDTGRTQSFNPETDPYNLFDLAKDVIGILDYFNIGKAYIFGMSMGGFITQYIAKHFPNRILSLIFIMTTINNNAYFDIPDARKLPHPYKNAQEALAEIGKNPRDTIDDKINSLVKMWQIFNGQNAKFDENYWRERAKLSFERIADNSTSAAKNHRNAMLNSEMNRIDYLKDNKILTLIIHGESDPIIPVEHAYYTHEHIPNSKLHIIKNMGHLLTDEFEDEIILAIINHLKIIQPDNLLHNHNI